MTACLSVVVGEVQAHLCHMCVCVAFRTEHLGDESERGKSTYLYESGARGIYVSSADQPIGKNITVALLGCRTKWTTVVDRRALYSSFELLGAEGGRLLPLCRDFQIHKMPKICRRSLTFALYFTHDMTKMAHSTHP